MGKHRSWTDDNFVEAVKSNVSVAGVLRMLELGLTGGNYQSVHCHVRRLKLSTAHWTGQGHLKGRTHNWTKKRPLEEILVEDSDYLKGSHLKKRLIREEILADVCAECGLGSGWREKPLVLVLDHINGIHSDNRLTNLRVLCPNCDSQSSTFGGRNKKK